jgi:hypothetical protein
MEKMEDEKISKLITEIQVVEALTEPLLFCQA